MIKYILFRYYYIWIYSIIFKFRLDDGGVMNAFIAMPFNPIHKEIEQAIRIACLQANFAPIRGDDIFQPGPIIDQIFSQILKSDCVIAVLTGTNPNVYYEIGIAFGLGKPVIFLHTEEDINNLPFDVKHQRVILYKSNDTNETIRQIQKQLEFISKNYSGQISSQMFLNNINFDSSKISKISEELMVEFGLPDLKLHEMELLPKGQGVFLKFVTLYGERVLVSVDNNGFITRLQKN